MLDREHSSSPQREYASVLTRFGAIIIDGLIMLPFYIPMFIIFAIFGENLEENDTMPGFVLIVMLATIIGIFAFAIWNTIIRMGNTGQSLGRKFLNIAVLNDRGEPIGVGSAFFREIIGRFISGLVCYIGYLNAFWDKDKQMWHDKMASCYVYYVEDNFS
ncbi:MAG: RDD family protein [Calditrichia bacterium]